MTAREYRKEGGLSRFSLDRRITVLVLFLTVLVVGVVATNRVPIELIPAGFEDPFLRVSVPWQDAPAREVMDKITLPLEEELSTVRGIHRISTLSFTGRSLSFLRFKHGTDMDVAYREVRDRIERARPRFPDEIDEIYIRKHDPSGIPLYVLGVAIDPSLTDSYNLIQNEIILPLSRVDGVASVEADGLVEKEVLIELDREKTAAAGLNIYEMATQLGSDNFTLASGNVREGSRKLLLRSVARFKSLDELERRLVSPSVRLGDVATISYEQPEKDFRVRAMSKPAVAVIVFKEGDANIRQVSDEVALAVERLKAKPRLKTVEMLSLLSQGDVIDEALSTLLNSGMIGGLIAACVLFLFMRRFRLMLIIAFGIPLSLLMGLTVMYFSGESLNLLTLLGLMLCVGLLVDNSVVVAENIHRLHRSGLDRRSACINGAGEVGLAITMSTLTTIVVFLPVALVDGPAQFFMLRLAIPVCVSVASSLLVALVFIPLAVYLTLGERPVLGDRPQGLIARSQLLTDRVLNRVYGWTFDPLNRGYNALLAFFMRRRFELVLALIFAFWITGFFPAAAVPSWAPAKNVKVVESQEEERGGFSLFIEMPRGSTLEETETWFLEAEKIVESKKEELGLEGWFHFHRAAWGEIEGWFTSPRSVDISPNEATRIVKEALPLLPGMKIEISSDSEDTDEEEGPEKFALTLFGEDPELLDDVAEQIEDLLVRLDGVLGLETNDNRVPDELALVVDREKAQRYGVNPQAVAGVVGYALRGTPLPDFHADGKEIPVRVRFKEEDRESLDDLANFSVPSESGALLPLSSLTRTEFLPAPKYIYRIDKRVSRTISLELEEENASDTRERLAALTGAIDLPEGVTLGTGGPGRTLDDDLANLRFAIVLSVVFIYLLMGFLFESFVLPLSIVLTIPSSLLGVYWIHFITGYDLDFLGFVSMVLLVGVVVNNGIVLVDYVNRLRSQGRDRTDALLTATHLRFRPIMMTAITTIGGMVPLALAGANSIGLSYTSFALTLIGGMTTATLLTLLVVPVFYTFFDDAREAFGRAARRVLVRPAPEPASVEESGR